MSSPKGFATWKPQKQTHRYLEDVLSVLNAQKHLWPLTQRYWLYRLMSKKGWSKFDEYDAATYRKANKGKNPPRSPRNLNMILNRGRRSGVIPWEAISSDRGMVEEPFFADSPASAALIAKEVINDVQFFRQEGQSRRIVLWMETEGMVPVVLDTAHHYGATVLAGKGFDVVGRKHDFARVIADHGKVTILHCGDLDKSGHSLFETLEEDLLAFITVLGGEMVLKRIALTEQQVNEYGLQATLTTPFTTNSGNHGANFDSHVECQLEAMDAGDLLSIIRNEFEANLDMDTFNKCLDSEPVKRAEAVRLLVDEIGNAEGRP